MLKVNDVRMLAVALEGLDNILSCGQKHFLNENSENRFSIVVEEVGCLDDLENLQQHPNHQIYKQALSIIDKYFADEEEGNPLISAINQA